MLAVIQLFGEIVVSPFEVNHTDIEHIKLSEMMKSTGSYQLSIAFTLREAGLYVSTVNTQLIHDYDKNTTRTGGDKKSIRPPFCLSYPLLSADKYYIFL